MANCRNMRTILVRTWAKFTQMGEFGIDLLDFALAGRNMLAKMQFNTILYQTGIQKPVSPRKCPEGVDLSQMVLTLAKIAREKPWLTIVLFHLSPIVPSG